MLLEGSWGVLGGLLGCLEAIVGVLERSFVDSGPCWAILGASGGPFCQSWSDLGAQHPHLWSGGRPRAPRAQREGRRRRRRRPPKKVHAFESIRGSSAFRGGFRKASGGPRRSPEARFPEDFYLSQPSPPPPASSSPAFEVFGGLQWFSAVLGRLLHFSQPSSGGGSSF